jgi:hypothetical protein
MSTTPTHGGPRTPGPGKKLGRRKRKHPVKAITITAPVALIDAHNKWRAKQKPRLSRTQAMALQCGWTPPLDKPHPKPLA